jgi:hypothetical protein
MTRDASIEEAVMSPGIPALFVVFSCFYAATSIMFCG